LIILEETTNIFIHKQTRHIDILSNKVIDVITYSRKHVIQYILAHNIIYMVNFVQYISITLAKSYQNPHWLVEFNIRNEIMMIFYYF